MIYEVAVVLNPDSGDQGVKNLKGLMTDLTSQFEGEVLISDHWGLKSYPKTAKAESKGNFVYFMYRSNTKLNAELERKLRINESVLKFLTIKLGPEKHQADYVKSYTNPFLSNNQ